MVVVNYGSSAGLSFIRSALLTNKDFFLELQ